MRKIGVKGEYQYKKVYIYDSLWNYLKDIDEYPDKDYYGLIYDKMLCYKEEQVGEVDERNRVSLFECPKKLRKESAIKKVELEQIDIDLISIEDIIKEIRELKIEFDNSPII